jgi:hypothetical protein
MKPRRHGSFRWARPAAWAGLLMLAACYNSLDYDSLKCRPGLERNCPEGFECRISGTAEKGRCCPIGDLACGVADAASSAADLGQAVDGTTTRTVLDAPTSDHPDAELDVPVTGGGGASGFGGHIADTGAGGAGGQGGVDAGTDAPLGTGGATGSGGASSGGANGTGGVSSTGGVAATGGLVGTGGVSSSGGVATTGGAVGTGVFGTGGVNGTGGSTVCPHQQVAASEVLWIGDSWLQMPNGPSAVPAVVRDLARGSETIGPTEAYADRSMSGQGIATIVSQYTRAPQGFKVLLMDGGGLDLQRGTQTDAGTNSAIDTVNSKFQELLGKAAVGGVQHIVFFLIPEVPGVPGIGPALTVLRPLLQQSCAASQVPCHFLDLQPLFAGRMSSLLSDLANPNADGAAIVGQAIWKLMEDDCIAQ